MNKNAITGLIRLVGPPGVTAPAAADCSVECTTLCLALSDTDRLGKFGLVRLRDGGGRLALGCLSIFRRVKLKPVIKPGLLSLPSLLPVDRRLFTAT